MMGELLDIEVKISHTEWEIKELERTIAGHEQAIINRKKELASKRRVLERTKSKHAAMVKQSELESDRPAPPSSALAQEEK